MASQPPQVRVSRRPGAQEPVRLACGTHAPALPVCTARACHYACAACARQLLLLLGRRGGACPAALHAQDFPYYFEPGISHDCLWADRPLNPVEVEELLSQHLPGRERLWWINPPVLQSVLTVSCGPLALCMHAHPAQARSAWAAGHCWCGELGGGGAGEGGREGLDAMRATGAAIPDAARSASSVRKCPMPGCRSGTAMQSAAALHVHPDNSSRREAGTPCGHGTCSCQVHRGAWSLSEPPASVKT